MTAFGVPAEDDDGNAAAASAPRAAAATPPGKTAYVDGEQLHQLQDIANRVGADLQRFCNYFGVESLKKVPVDRFTEAKAALEAKSKKKEPANA